VGKFSDALAKAGTPPVKPGRQKPAEPKIEQSTDLIADLRLDTAPEEPQVETHCQFDGHVDPRLICFRDVKSPAAEYFKLLRAKILTHNSGTPLRTLMVTSSQPLDGKSIVAANLAVSIAHGINEHVLLVDCDLRRPSLHRLFGLEASRGLREYLEGDEPLGSYLLKTPVKKLSLLPAGNPPANPSELLSSQKMEALIQEMKTRYQDRYIILDATPAQFAAETTCLATTVDGVLLVVRSGKTPGQLALDAIENIGKKHILGVVFNASTENLRTYRKYYQYG